MAAGMTERPRPAMAGRERVKVGDPQSCALCGIVEGSHGEMFGLGHIGAPDFGVPTGFVPPSAELLALRAAVRIVDGHPIGAVNSQGEAITHLVRVPCRCGADTVVTPENAGRARCSSCMHADADERVANDPGLRALIGTPRTAAAPLVRRHEHACRPAGRGTKEPTWTCPDCGTRWKSQVTGSGAMRNTTWHEL